MIGAGTACSRDARAVSSATADGDDESERSVSSKEVKGVRRDWGRDGKDDKVAVMRRCFSAGGEVGSVADFFSISLQSVVVKVGISLKRRARLVTVFVASLVSSLQLIGFPFSSSLLSLSLSRHLKVSGVDNRRNKTADRHASSCTRYSEADQRLSSMRVSHSIDDLKKSWGRRNQQTPDALRIRLSAMKFKMGIVHKRMCRQKDVREVVFRGSTIEESSRTDERGEEEKKMERRKNDPDLHSSLVHHLPGSDTAAKPHLRKYGTCPPTSPPTVCSRRIKVSLKPSALATPRYPSRQTSLQHFLCRLAADGRWDFRTAFTASD